MIIWDKIEGSICDLEKLLDVSITIIDREGVLHHEDGHPFFSQTRQSHRKNRICELGFCQKCVDHCRHKMNAKGEKEGHFFVNKCWKGAMEVVVPIIKDGAHLGSFFAGIWRAPKQTEPENAHLLPESAKKEYASLPPMDFAYAEKLGNVLSIFVQGFLSSLDEIKTLNDFQPGNKIRISHFLHKHASSAPGLKDLASELNLSLSRTSHLVKELYGKSFQELLKQERLKRAKTLLLSTDDTVREIAERIGMPDEYHFSKVFKKHAGLPPGKFRKANRK